MVSQIAQERPKAFGHSGCDLMRVQRDCSRTIYFCDFSQTICDSFLYSVTDSPGRSQELLGIVAVIG